MDRRKLYITDHEMKRKHYMVDFNYHNVRVYFERMKLNEAVYTRYLMEKKVYDKFRHRDNDDKIFKQIESLSEERKRELDRYTDLKVKEYLSKGGSLA